MNKKELQQELDGINQRLTALGDLNELVQQGQGLPNLISDAQTKKVDIESFLSDLPVRNEELNQLIAEVKKLNEQTEARDGEASELTTEIEKLQGKVEKLIEETQAQLGIAANAKLASTFEGVKEELRKEKKKLFKWLIVAVVVLVIVTGAVVYWQINQDSTLYHFSFPIRLALLSPIVYFVVFINREYSRVRSLIEEYTFKAAIARSFEAYKEIVQDLDSSNPKRTLDFVLDSIKDLYSSPMVNIKNNSQKEKENTPDALSPVKSAVDEMTSDK